MSDMKFEPIVLPVKAFISDPSLTQLWMLALDHCGLRQASFKHTLNAIFPEPDIRVFC